MNKYTQGPLETGGDPLDIIIIPDHSGSMGQDPNEDIFEKQIGPGGTDPEAAEID